jgi:hypothetical protein
MVSGADAAVGSEATVGTSLRPCACANGMHSAHTPLDIMLTGNLAPSSLQIVSDSFLGVKAYNLLRPINNPNPSFCL